MFTYLLHHAIRLELVAIRQTAHQSPLTMLIDAQRAHFAFRPTKALWVLGRIAKLIELVHKERVARALFVFAAGSAMA